MGNTEPEWRTIPSFPLYEASNDCQIRRIGKRVLKQRDNGHGYVRVTVSCSNIQSHPYVHQLVCEAFHGPRPNEMETRHFDGSRTNNIPSNLAWATRLVNQQDKITHGTLNNGERQGNAVLTSALVSESRSRISAGERAADIAREYQVNEATLRDAIRGRRWGHISGALDAFPARKTDLKYPGQKKYHDRLRAAGLCFRCRTPCAPHTNCEPCRILKCEYMRRRTAQKAEAEIRRVWGIEKAAARVA